MYNTKKNKDTTRRIIQQVPNATNQPGAAGMFYADHRPEAAVQRKIVFRDGNTLQKKSAPRAQASPPQDISVHEPKTTQLKASGTTKATAQLAKRKQAAYTAGGAVSLGLTGAAIGSVVPAIGTVTGGLVGLVAGAIGGYLYSKPKIYSNLQAKEYRKELSEYEKYKKEFRRSRSAYERGTIIRYSKSTSQAFTDLLHEGNVLYTYDENNQLSIGSGVGPMKHAIVSGNKKIKAAGWAKIQFTQAQTNQKEYQQAASKVERLALIKEEYEERALKILDRYGLELHEVDSIKNEKDRDIVMEYKTAESQLSYYLEEMKRLRRLNRQSIAASKNNRIQLDNESGHYHPGKETKDEAFEGWRNAGFNNLTWKSWGKK